MAQDGAIVPAELGVRCEDCHGPAAAHVRDPRGARPLQPGRMTALDINGLCGACHRRSAGAEATINLRDPWNARHQPLLLASSRCFQSSGGRLSCLTCHQPHAAAERNASGYDAKCANCHRAVRHTAAVAQRACTGCHMPLIKPGPWLSFANHRIAIYAPGDPLTAVSRR